MTQRYSPEQVQDILVQAMNQLGEPDFSRSQLEEMATDLGLTAKQLDLAEAQLATSGAAPLPSQANKLPRTAFRQQLRSYVLVNSFLLLLNFWSLDKSKERSRNTEIAQ